MLSIVSVLWQDGTAVSVFVSLYGFWRFRYHQLYLNVKHNDILYPFGKYARTNDQLTACIKWSGAWVNDAKSFQIKVFSRKLGCDWLMFYHQPITAKLFAKSF